MKMKSAEQRYPGTLLFSRPAFWRSNMTTESQLKLDVPQLVLKTHERCRDYLSPTPLEYSPYLSARVPLT